MTQILKKKDREEKYFQYNTFQPFKDSTHTHTQNKTKKRKKNNN